MAIDTSTLRGAIYAEYKNLTAFCSAVGIARATVDNVLDGKVDPTLQTARKMANGLHRLTAEQKYQIFFADAVA